MSYEFRGLWPFIQRASHGRDAHYARRCRDLWHVRQVQDALGQISRVDPLHRRDLIDHAVKVRQSLACALEGVDFAILEVAREFDLFPEKPAEPGEVG